MSELQWTKTPPGKEHVGKLFAIRFHYDSYDHWNQKIAGSECLVLRHFGGDGTLCFGTFSLDAWVLKYEAEFLGPLPE